MEAAMPAQVSITTTAIGCHARQSWHSVGSGITLKQDEVDVKVEFGISHVRGGYQAIKRAFEALKANGDIDHFYLGMLGSTPYIVCHRDRALTCTIQRKGTVDSPFSLALRDKLQTLLDSDSKS